jgi:hypothetical protein
MIVTLICLGLCGERPVKEAETKCKDCEVLVYFHIFYFGWLR